jgi:TRAP-type C4-dicarboxylate transport system permease small subunit
VSTAAPGGLRWLEQASAWFNRALAALAGVALMAMMAFTALDVLLRSLGRPVAGSFEVIGWLSAVALALALGYVQLHRGHVAMTLVSDRLRGRTAALMEAVTALLALALMGACAVHVVRYGLTLQDSGSLSETLKVVVFPWVYAVGLGFAGLTLALLLDALRSLHRLWRGTPRDAT